MLYVLMSFKELLRLHIYGRLPIQVEVKGMPRVTRILEEAVAVSGRDVRLEAEFCSDPEPLTVSH